MLANLNVPPAHEPLWSDFPLAATDMEIYVSNAGDDKKDGLTPETALKTIAAGIKKLRNGTGDRLLLRRGDTFRESFGMWTRSGRSEAEPMVIGSYGSKSVARPMILPGYLLGLETGSTAVDYLVIKDIVLYAAVRDPNHKDYVLPPPRTIGIRWLAATKSLLIENVTVRYFSSNINLQSYFGKVKNVMIRGCSVLDAHSADSTIHSQGIYAEAVDGLSITSSLIDHNGWHETVKGSEQTMFNHNVYVTSDCTGLKFEDNIVTRGSSHGIQARSGGDILDNVYWDNAIHCDMGLVNGGSHPTIGGITGTVQGNIFFVARGIAGVPRGWALEIANTKPMTGTGSLYSVGVTNNVFVDKTGKKVEPVRVTYGNSSPSDAVGINDLLIYDNVFHWNGPIWIDPSMVSGTTPGQKSVNRLNLGVMQNYYGDANTPLMDLADYALLLGNKNEADFLLQARQNERYSWDTHYSARGIWNALEAYYIKVTTPPTPVPPVPVPEPDPAPTPQLSEPSPTWSTVLAHTENPTTKFDGPFDGLLVDTSKGDVNVELPLPSAVPHALFIFKKIDATANKMRLVGQIDGVLAPTFHEPGQVVRVYSDGVLYYFL